MEVTAADSLSRPAQSRFLAREKFPFLTGDWLRVLFIHYEVPKDLLSRSVPFELELFQGRAFVSTVSFTMERLRPGAGGAIGKWLLWPIATTDFFNVRAYVRHNGEPGIYFMREWLNNRLSVMTGPLTYGLPYRFGRIRYNHRPEQGRFDGSVADSLAYTAKSGVGARFQQCAPGSLDEFLLERYRAFTRRGARLRYFDIWHEPWRQIPVEAEILDDRLLRRNFPWFEHAQICGANYSPGLQGVWMGQPHGFPHPPKDLTARALVRYGCGQ